MHLFAFYLTPAQLRAIPVRERALFMTMARALNELNTLGRLLYFSTQGVTEADALWLRHSLNTQCLFLARLQVSKLNEMHEVIQQGYLNTKLAQKFSPQKDGDEKAHEALEKLTAYFGRSDNLVTIVRNQFGFHYDMAAAQIEVPDEISPAELAMYLDGTSSNALFQFAETALDIALRQTVVKHARRRIAAGQTPPCAELLDPHNPESIHIAGALFDELQIVTRWVNDFGQWLVVSMLKAHVDGDPSKTLRETIDVGDLPRAADVRLPYFTQ